MGNALEYDVFDALVDKLLKPLTPLEDCRRKVSPKTATADARPNRSYPSNPRKA